MHCVGCSEYRTDVMKTLSHLAYGVVALGLCAVLVGLGGCKKAETAAETPAVVGANGAPTGNDAATQSPDNPSVSKNDPAETEKQ